jgi:hypothetical protein
VCNHQQLEATNSQDGRIEIDESYALIRHKGCRGSFNATMPRLNGSQEIKLPQDRRTVFEMEKSIPMNFSISLEAKMVPRYCRAVPFFRQSPIYRRIRDRSLSAWL